MIWYLLYPFRGTTNPPILSPSHPIRKAFTSYGRIAARHPVTCISISVALSTALVYPLPFLYTNNFTNGTANLPNHVWTAAEPFEGPTSAVPDIVMRSLWVHGDFMKALDLKVLQTALEIQDKLLGSTIDFDPTRARDITEGSWMGYDEERMQLYLRDHYHASNGMSNQSWFFHSPLLYWSGSQQALLDDNDILDTVSKGAHHSTRANVTLRHPIVFSGKRFEDSRLVAADALVITLLHKLDSPVGRQWEREAQNLAILAGEDWHLFPRNGRVTNHKLYEFQFEPLSFQDNLILGSAYGLAALYLFVTLRRLRAFKSRVGLTITILSQLALSITSSFTICAVLKIDLSRIPRVAYPFLVGTMGIENAFRLINAVLGMPSEMSPATRLAEALGRTGHVTLAKVCENLVVLWLFYHVVVPSTSMQAFFLFSAIALVLDFLYILTFLVSVLSIDVLRTELRDSLDRVSRQQRIEQGKSRRISWIDGILQGDAPASTHVAGSIVMIGFILLAQRHFLDQQRQPLQMLNRISRLFHATDEPQSVAFAELNQARSPTAWLKLQAHQTAREVIQIVNPSAHSYVARVFEPLVVVLNGSDRTPTKAGVRLFLPAAYDFLAHQSWSFVITILFVTAAISLLMKYLLWDEEIQEHESQGSEAPSRMYGLETTTIGDLHTLDISLITACATGVVVTWGLDRKIGIWHTQEKQESYMIRAAMPGLQSFPVLAIALDDSGHWLAIFAGCGHAVLWHIDTRCWGPRARVVDNPYVSKPLYFAFEPSVSSSIPGLLLVDRHSVTYRIDYGDHSPRITQSNVCKSPLVQVRQYWDVTSTRRYTKHGQAASGPGAAPALITVSHRGCVHVVRQSSTDDTWQSKGIEDIWPKTNEVVRAIVPLPTINCFLAIRDGETDLVDLSHDRRIHTFDTAGAIPSSVQAMPIGVCCTKQGVISLSSFSLLYTDQSSTDCVMITYLPSNRSRPIAVSLSRNAPGTNYSCWTDVTVSRQEITNPGEWTVLPVGVVLGVRRHRQQPARQNVALDKSHIRQRIHARKTEDDNQAGSMDVWEAWICTPQQGEVQTMPLINDGEDDRFIRASSCGPMHIVGRRSVAIGLGNLVKVVRVGDEWR